MTEVVVESGRRRTFVAAVEWPGWARSATTEDAALEALGSYVDRYAPLVAAIGRPGTSFVVVSRLEGDTTTDFGAISKVHPLDGPLSEPARSVAILDALWARLRVVANDAPEELRKGPRGGGRDTSAVVEHVAGAEAAYARSIGVESRGLSPDGLRDAIRRRLLQTGDEPTSWPPTYFVRRVAWHVTDHIWEIEDRSAKFD